MAQPKQGTSRSKTKIRRKSFRLKSINLIACEQCGSLKPAHHICLVCGIYRGKKYLDVEKKERKERKRIKTQEEEQKPQKEAIKKVQEKISSDKQVINKPLTQRTTSK
jgi:large subunit ribosomal protein L32